METKQYEHQLSVEFGGVSIGDETASVGVSFERNGHTLDAVDQMLCGKRLEVFAVIGAAGHPDQKQLPGMEGEPHPHVAASCDSRKVSIDPKQFSARLKFSLGEIDVTQIAGLAKRSGTLRLNVLGECESGGSDADPDGEFDDATRPTRQRQKALPPAAAVPTGKDPADVDPIENLATFGLSQKQCEKIRDSALEITTVGDLIRAIARDQWWSKKIKGIGPANIDKVTDAIIEYRKARPAPDPDDDQPTEGGEVAVSGEPCGTVNRWETGGDDWCVKIGITPAPDYRASVFSMFGGVATGTDTPTTDLPTHKTRVEAVVDVLGPIIDAWTAKRGAQRKAGVALKAWADEQFAPKE